MPRVHFTSGVRQDRACLGDRSVIMQTAAGDMNGSNG